MTGDLNIRLKLIRRRARSFSRQIALAAVLTALATGFLASAMFGHSRDRSEIASSIVP